MQMNFSAGNIKVLVAYDNFSSGCRAMEILKRLAGRGGVSGELTHFMMRFDLMADATFFELAVSEALVADMVVIATMERMELPQRVQDWVVQWILRKQDAPQALVATFEENGNKMKEAGGVAEYLEKLAGYGRIQFFSTEGDQVRKVDFGMVKGDDWAVDSALVRQQAAGKN